MSKSVWVAIAFLLLLLSQRCCADDLNAETELTLAMIKPDGVSGNYTDSIKNMILESGFGINEEVLIHMDEDTVKNFYSEHSSRSFFSSLVQYMTSGPVVIMVLEKANAVADWRALIGPTNSQTAKLTHPHSIRALCGVDLTQNCVHGSDSPQSALREMSFFFKKPSSGSTTRHEEL